MSNIDKANATYSGDLGSYTHAQTFTTGNNTSGYTLSSIEVDFTGTTPSGLTFSLWSVGSDGKPSAKLVDLSNPPSLSGGVNDFTAPSGTKLLKQTSYAIYMSGGVGLPKYTTSNGEDDVEPGWSIRNNSWDQSGSGWNSEQYALQIKVKGTVDQAGSDATLSALSLTDASNNPIALSPTFVLDNSLYMAFVANGVNAVTLAATTTSSGATVAITGDDNAATPGEATLDLTEGANTLTVTVTATDSTTRTYTVTVVRAASAPPADPNAIWTANLTVGSGGGTLGDPSFGYHRGNSFGTLAPRAFTYNSSTVTVKEFAYYPIPPSPGFPARTIMDFTGTLASGDYVLHLGAMSFPFSHDAINTDVEIDVGSLDWGVGDVVLVKLVRPPNNDATLSALGLEDGDGATVSLSPGFNRTTDSYTARVSDDVDEVTLTATQNDAGATVAITADDDSSTPNEATFVYDGNRTTLTVTVTSSDGNRTRTYTVAVVRTSKEARLKGFWMASIGWIRKTPSHDPDTTAYVTSVDADDDVFAGGDELTLMARPLVSGATAAVTGGPAPLRVVNRNDGTMSAKLDIPHGSTTWTVTVTSADGSETKTYTMTVNRGTVPPDVRLKTLTVTPVDEMGTELSVLSFSPSFHLDTEAATFRVRVPSDTDAVTVSVEKNSFLPNVRLMRTETVRLDSLDEDPDLAGIQFELTMDRFDLGGARENRYKSIWVIGPNSTRFFNRRVYQLWITKAAEGVGLATAADPLMAAFENAPLSHDGSSAFTFRMAFSEDVEITPEDMRDHAFVVSGGTVTGAERVDGLKSLWELTLEPTGSGAVSILTPLERACTEAGALCTADGRSLSVAPALQVAGPVPAAPALTASFESVPEAHDGSTAFTFRMAFSADVEITPEDMRDQALSVTGATVTAAARVDDRKDLWELTLEPSGSGTVSILTPLERACTEAGALCTADGRSLTVGLGVQVLGPPPAPALTASFASVPQAHDGTSAFTVRLAFSAPIRNSYQRLRDEALSVTGGTAKRARRVDGRSDLWEVTVEPSGHGAVTVELAAAASCADTGALCTADGRALSNAITTTVAGPPPLTAAFVSVPAEHDGQTEFWLELSFNAAVVQGSKERIRALLGVTGGSVTRLRRKDDRLDHWRVRVQPSSHGAVTVTLSPSPACGATGAVCTPDGRTYTTALATRIQGPPGLAVADAEVEEGPNASLAFAVTLSRAPSGTVTVDYATSDGTATAGSDYTATSGTVTFAAGETEKTVSVAVLDDAHDEGSETLGLTLSNASGAHIADGSATGTINNTDHMPQAWLARFGRTVADQVVDAVGERLRGPGGAGAEVRVAGQDLSGATPNNEATREAEAQARIESLAKWLRGESEEDRQPLQSRTLTSRDFLTGTSFALTGGTAQTGFGSLWGRGALSRFDGREDELTLDGEVASAMLGADWTQGPAMAGVAVAHSRGEGGYRSPAGSGEVETTLTGLYPYGRYAVDERLTVWGVLGYGTGTLTLTPEGQPPMEADTDLAMAAAGVRGELLRAPESGGMELAVRSDALAVRTTSETVPGPGGMKASEADVTRLRLGLEGSRAFRSGAGAALTPSLDIGVRHDGGDAETGFGVDIGAGLAWTDPASGMKAKVDARGLLTHEDGGFRERGIAGSLAWDPSPSSSLGPSLTLRHSVGVSATRGVDALFNPDTARRLAANDDDYELERRRFEAVLGYGVPVLGHRFIGTPELGMGVSDTGREVRLGWRLGLARGGERVSFDLGLEAARRESANDDRAPEGRIGLRLNMRW